MFHGLNSRKCRNNKMMSHSLMDNKLCRKDCRFCDNDTTYLCNYQKQHPWLVQLLSINTLFKNFLPNLAIVIDKNSFLLDRIYKMGETCVTTVQSPENLLCEKAEKNWCYHVSRARRTFCTHMCNKCSESAFWQWLFFHVSFKKFTHIRWAYRCCNPKDTTLFRRLFCFWALG